MSESSTVGRRDPISREQVPTPGSAPAAEVEARGSAEAIPAPVRDPLIGDPRIGDPLIGDPLIGEQQGPSATDGLMDHSYDGIQEYDNPLPGWWTAIFALTIAFSVLYAVYYHGGEGRLIEDEYARDAAALTTLRSQSAGAAGADEAALAALTGDEAAMAAAATTYAGKCAACHGDKGQGLIGPNLTDDHWLNGGSLTEIYQTITEGVPAKGMIAWGPLLAPAEISQLTAYLRTLQGSQPPNPKAPEGEKVTSE